MAILQKAIYRFSTISINIPTQFFRHGKRNSQFHMEKQKPRIAKTILNNKRTSGSFTIPDLNLYYRTIVIKIAWYGYRDRQVDQWNRIEDPEINPHIYGHLIFDKEAKPSSVKRKASLTNGSSLTGRLSVEESKLIHIYLLVQSSSTSGSRTSI
jgi:hypothetical protein